MQFVLILKEVTLARVKLATKGMDMIAKVSRIMVVFFNVFRFSEFRRHFLRCGYFRPPSNRVKGRKHRETHLAWYRFMLRCLLDKLTVEFSLQFWVSEAQLKNVLCHPNVVVNGQLIDGSIGVELYILR